MSPAIPFPQDIPRMVAWALEEDIRDGDITAGLIPADTRARATLITREDCVLAGSAWVDEVFRQVDPAVRVDWQFRDGDRVPGDSLLARFEGPARALLTGERTALNFLQTLSGTATTCRHYADLVADTAVRLLDTRKTLPGLRSAQKYAVTCGGCHNHRQGLHDAFLIKENHIAACGSIPAAIAAARANAPGKPVEVEVETLEEFKVALEAGSDIIMLDDMSLEDTYRAVVMAKGQARLEISGGVNPERLKALAATGVDYISIGALTKHVRAIDLSMRIHAL
jgi:nicotinate-nucleotide pyrophosphorylase (carboxylating)